MVNLQRLWFIYETGFKDLKEYYKKETKIYNEGEPLHIFLMWIFYRRFIVIRVFMSFLNKNNKCGCSYVPVALVVQSAEKHDAWCKDACVTLPKTLNMIT